VEARAFRPAKNAASKGAFRHGAPGSDFLKHTVANPVVLLPQPDGNYPRGSHAPPFAEPASRALLPLGYRGRSAPLPGAGGSTGLQPSQYGLHKIPVFSPRRLNLKGAPPLSPFLGDRVGSTRYIQMPRCPIRAGFARSLPKHLNAPSALPPCSSPCPPCLSGELVFPAATSQNGNPWLPSFPHSQISLALGLAAPVNMLRGQVLVCLAPPRSGCGHDPAH